MKTILFTFIASLILTSVTAQEDVKGIWYNSEKTSKIKIFKATNGKYYGKLVWVRTAGKKDMNNPDPEKKDTPLLDMIFMKGFTYNADKKQWTGGTIYDPDNGKTYDCYMWFEGDSREILHVKGYVLGMKFVGRKVEWTKTSL